jgi:hypothetical protein
MTDILDLCREALNGVGFSTRHVDTESTTPAIIFESDTILGFALAYEQFHSLILDWRTDVDGLFSTHSFGLRRAGDKAWNAYAVILCRQSLSGNDAVALGAIDEDLVGFRKVTYAGISDAVDIRDALLPLLPLQSAPKLEAVDMTDEIKLRTRELSERVVEGFLAGADEGVMLQVMEEAS